MDNQHISQKLKEYRLARNLSRRALAEKAQVAERTVTYAETHGNITLATIQKLARALDIPIGFLLS